MFKTIKLSSTKPQVVVAGVFEGTATVPADLKKLDKDTGGAIARGINFPGFTGKIGEIAQGGDGHFVVGLGKKDSLSLVSVRTVGAKVVKALDSMGIKSVRLNIASVVPASVASADNVTQSLAEGMALANFRVDFFDGSATRNEKPRTALLVWATDKARKTGFERGLTIAASTNYARRIAATPPNVCNPTFMAKEARRMAREVGLTCKVINFEQAQKLGMGGIVNVGKGSDSKPRLIVLEHKPARVAAKAKGKTLSLVGKTITYDTGGYSLKISNGMKGMKYDKNGGMAVLGAMHAIASLRLPVRVVALLPTAENMVNGDAYRPDDIITMYNGVSVEVTNTDAEGRLVLGDALAYACKQYKPTAIVDLATLTGGVVVALGSWCAGLWCDDDALRGRIESAAEATGEKVWRLPLWSDHKDFMRSKHADIWNSGPKRDGHPIQGAAFLSYFVDEKTPWAHIDIAGTSSVDGDTDLYVTGPTGYGVRLMTQFVQSYC